MKTDFIYCRYLKKIKGGEDHFECMLSPDYPKPFKNIDNCLFEERIGNKGFLPKMNVNDYFLIKITSQPGKVTMEICEDKKRLKWFKKFMNDFNTKINEDFDELIKNGLF